MRRNMTLSVVLILMTFTEGITGKFRLIYPLVKSDVTTEEMIFVMFTSQLT